MTRRYYRAILALGTLLASFILISLIYSQALWPGQEPVPDSHLTAQYDIDPPTTDADTSVAPDSREPSIFSQIFETGGQSAQIEGWAKRAGTLTFRLALAALLAAMLAFRRHKSLPILHRNPYVAETQILLAVVAAALMMIVGDNAARAFGIFAAASLIRFRTNIRDPKEITVLLVNLAIGLAAGVGRWELAIIFSLFMLALLRILEHYEPAQVFRSMELKVKTHNVEETDQALREVFKKKKLSVEVQELDREDPEHPLGKVVYHVDVSPAFSTDRLGEEIFSSDPENIDSVEWHQKKTSSYIYR
jgi:uncharacterized membrane protein YhiD involved in acid resistance